MVSRIFMICDAYESGIGHGLQQDKHSSGEYFDIDLNKAYEIGYRLGEERKIDSLKTNRDNVSNLD